MRPIDTTGLKPAQLRDQPQPSLIWVDIADLVIDPRYQRQITPKGRGMIQRIANNWDWRKSQPILVAGSESSKYAVVDGQHRAHAAALCGIRALPAMLVPMSLTEQAAGFAAINRDRVSMTMPQIFRAELAAGTPWAIAARDAVAAAGCTLLTYNPTASKRQPGEIMAINLIRKMVEAGEGEAVTVGLRAIRASETGRERDYYGVDAYSGAVLTPWLRALATNQRFLRLPDLAGMFDQLDIHVMLDTARDAARQNGGSPRDRVIAQIVARLRAEIEALAA